MTGTLTMANIRPWGRAALIESPVDEAQRPSGLIVPLGDDAGSDVARGVLLHVDDADLPAGRRDVLRQGMAVYYRAGIKIGDVIIVELDQIVAYEADE